MQEKKVDKLGFFLIVCSIILLIYGWCVYQNYSGFNSFLMNNVAEILKVINPPSELNVQTMKSGGFYVTEERVIFVIFLISFLCSFLSFLKVIHGKITGAKLQTFASMFTISLVLSFCNIYVIVSSGLLLDV